MRIHAVRGDITAQDVDAVVDAANPWLANGAGVAGALWAAGGPEYHEACRAAAAALPGGQLATGAAVATVAGDLPARWVIHTVGPRIEQQPDGRPDLLAACHTASLDRAHELGAASVAFPALSCGVYGWRAADAAPIAVAAVREWAAGHPDSSVREVRFVLFDAVTCEVFGAAIG